MKRIAAVLLLAPAVVLCEPIDGLKPMAFLAGHCWRGTFPDGRRTDEHCFAWVLGGQALRDVHTLKAPGQADYVGETLYYWEPSARRVEFLYVENAGGVSKGSMQPAEDVLVFPPAQYVAPGQALLYRARWTPMGDEAYEAFSEAQTPEGWKTMFRVVLRRVEK
jgi:hypothetical protein